MRGWGGRHIMWPPGLGPGQQAMVFQRDKGAPPDSFETGLPPAQSGEDVPRWLVDPRAWSPGLTLLVALLRYAIDLLGVVFVIILVGFAIRALSDWLTEGESVSGWAMSALSLGLMGTVLVGLWLFNSRDLAVRDPADAPARARSSARCRGWSRRGGASACCCPAVRRPERWPAAVPPNLRGGGAPAADASDPGRAGGDVAARTVLAGERRDCRRHACRGPAARAGVPRAGRGRSRAASRAGRQPPASPPEPPAGRRPHQHHAHGVAGARRRGPLRASDRASSAPWAPTPHPRGTVAFSADDVVLGQRDRAQRHGGAGHARPRHRRPRAVGDLRRRWRAPAEPVRLDLADGRAQVGEP